MTNTITTTTTMPASAGARDRLLLWVDTETDGVNPELCEIFEVGLKLTDMRATRILRSMSVVVRRECVHVDRGNWKAIRMHVDNHLLDECLDDERSSSMAAVGLQVGDFITAATNDAIVYPAGTNLTFDLRIIRRILSSQLDGHTADRIMGLLHYRHQDITSLRLADQALDHNPYQHHAGTHRVDDCLTRDIQDYREYLQRLNGDEQ